MCGHECCVAPWPPYPGHFHGHSHGHPEPHVSPYCWGPCCCCCCPCGGYLPQAPFGFVRRFRTKEEKIAELEAYLEALKKEAQAVEEKLRRLREE